MALIDPVKLTDERKSFNTLVCSLHKVCKYSLYTTVYLYHHSDPIVIMAQKIWSSTEPQIVLTTQIYAKHNKFGYG